ncbi:MAG: leucine-rich repeat domain-containing protein, partial [Clostridia bacterium]|nr:leucine-rich repeat domain-containing protein [Clostridia bacterium]
MKNFKKLLPYIFTVAIIVVIMVVAGTTVYAESYSGSCGDDLTWTLDTSTGVLDISGTGEMSDYSYAVNEAPWCSYRSYIKYVNIGDSVTSIGDYAFWRCTSLISVTISDSLTNIGDSAFGNCTSLESVTIPDSVTNICDEAFSYCSSLKNVYITDIATWCGIDFESSYSNPLYYADNLYLNGEPITDLVIPDSATIIGDYAFGNCTFLTSVTISDSVISIGDYAFENCTSLTSVTISDSVTSIGYYTFSF